MHTQFVGCLTCHNDQEKVPQDSLQFSWLNYSGIEVSGQPFGIEINPNTGSPALTDDYFSKIVVRSDGELLELTPNNPQTIDFAAVYRKLSDNDREAVKERFHKLTQATGRQCSRCHTSQDPYLPFAELGFSERRQQDLENLPIIGLIDKYKQFFMPNLLRPRQE